MGDRSHAALWPTSMVRMTIFLALTTNSGYPFAFTGSSDENIICWDLRYKRPLYELSAGNNEPKYSFSHQCTCSHVIAFLRFMNRPLLLLPQLRVHELIDWVRISLIITTSNINDLQGHYHPNGFRLNDNEIDYGSDSDEWIPWPKDAKHGRKTFRYC